jgi:hypothetical protein
MFISTRDPATSVRRGCAALLLTALVATAAGGCKPASSATAAAPGTASPAATATTAAAPSPVPASRSLCDQIIDINTSAGYMVNKAFTPGGPTPAQLEKIVNLVLLRESDLVAAATAAGMADNVQVVLGFYQALASAAGADPGFYADYLATKPAAVQRIAAAVDPSLPAKQKALAGYEEQTCGITFPG